MHISNKCSVAVHCLLYIYEYSSKTKVTSELLSLSTGCNPVTIRSILSALKKDGILSVHAGVGGAEIICPLEDISMYRICMAVEPKTIDHLVGVHSTPSDQCPVGKEIHTVLKNTYTTLQNDVAASMKTITMQDFVNEYHTCQK